MAASIRNVFLQNNFMQNTLKYQHVIRFQLVNSTQCYSSIVSWHSNMSNRFCKQLNSKLRRVLFYTGTTVGISSLIYLKHNNTLWKIPTVAALSNRKKYDFMSELVAQSVPAVVEIIDQQYSIPLSLGSGFIVRSDGLILTNAHVVGNKGTIGVKLQDGREFNGVVQAVDSVSDLATVKVNGADLPTIQLGKSSSMKPGEWVIAIGSPYSLSSTVTHGIVSSANRKLGDSLYIQTDATIDKGNSGGPLVNMDGEAIGINAMMKVSGIGFAIPSDCAQNFLDRALVVEKRTNTGDSAQRKKYLGIKMFTLTPDLLLNLHYYVPHFSQDLDHGVMVVHIVPNSPAHRCGLQEYDVIVSVDNKEVHSSSDIYKIIDQAKKTLKLKVVRGSDVIFLNIMPEHSSR